jgi:hypothetical protein
VPAPITAANSGKHDSAAEILQQIRDHGWIGDDGVGNADVRVCGGNRGSSMGAVITQYREVAEDQLAPRIAGVRGNPEFPLAVRGERLTLSS